MGLSARHVLPSDYHDWRRAWAVAGLVILLVVSVRAITDADQLAHHNCWQIRKASANVAIMECTPHGGTPYEHAPVVNNITGTENDSYTYCDEFEPSI